ncbi:MAG TPA: flagellar assembly protein FliW, partial [Thauera aminoaromatica]|nr:flagellar assembly protein FliW [Thauera aminoaromatica]
MKVETYLFGAVEVSPEKVIEFPNGLVGFEQNKRFMLAHEDGTAQPSSYTLQSLDDPNLAFQIVDPVTLGFNYELNLSDAETALLQSPAPEDVLVMQVLFKQEEDGKARITPSLRAPLLINTKARIGMQKVMETLRSNITLSNLASTGIYLFEPAVLELIPQGKEFDIGSELFPLLVDRKMPFYAQSRPFHWIDIGKVTDYWSVLQRVLAGEIADMRMPGKEVRPGVWV